MSREVSALGILLALLAACAGPEEPTSSASTSAPSASTPALAASLPRDGTIWIPHPGNRNSD